MENAEGGREPSFRFGPYRLVPGERQLTCSGSSVPLPPKLFELLLLLVRARGQLVSRQAIVQAIWPDVLVSDTNLRQKVWMLRKALREREAGAYIETLPRQGYRFLVPVALEENEVALPPQVRSPGTPAPPSVPRVTWASRRIHSRLRLAAVVLVGLAAATTFTWGQPTSCGRRLPPHAPGPVAAAPAAGTRSVAVLGLQNLSGDPQDEWMAEALAEMLRAELSLATSLRLVPAETIREFTADLSPLRGSRLSAASLAQLRHSLGGDVVVAGTYVIGGRDADAQLHVDLLVHCTMSGRITSRVRTSAARRELPDLASRAGRDLRRALDVARSLPPTN